MLIIPPPISIERVSLDRALKLDVPRYSPDQLPGYNCARYARLSSHFIFGKKFPVAHAWQMREKTKIISKLNENSQLVSLIKKGAVSPGMLLGVFCKGSHYLAGGRTYTHLSVYLGAQSNKHLFLEQIGDEIRIVDLHCYDLEKKQIKEVLDLRP